MKEKLLEILKEATYYPRKIVDFFLFNFYLKFRNDWNILNNYKNKKVVIVGNGPSLNKTPLDKLKENFISIGMNKINLIYEKTTWKPDIITCVNGFIIKQNKNYFNKSDRILILPVRAIYLGVKPRRNILFVNLKDQFKIEKNIEKVLSTGCTVTFTSLQIAAYLEPKSINIVGVDHSFKIEKGSSVQKFKGDDVNHFSKDYFKNQYWGLPDLEGSELLYNIAKKYFDTLKIPIIDNTVNGKLDVFEKQAIKNILK